MNETVILQAIVLAYVLMQFVDALLKPLIEIVNMLLTGQGEQAKQEAIRRWPLYLTLLVVGSVAWFAELNVLDSFFPNYPMIGRVLTAMGVGLGPSFLHNLKPKESVQMHVYQMEQATKEDRKEYYDWLNNPPEKYGGG